MKHLSNGQRGVTLLELLVVLMVLSLILTAAVKTWDVTLERGRTETTVKKLRQLSTAITGDPNYIIAGRRVDFGFVGDVGRLPSSLIELVVSPAIQPPESSLWRGPYLRSTFNQSSEGYRIDGWGDTIAYVNTLDSLFLRSLGGRGLADRTRWQTVKLPNTFTELTRNDVTGTVLDVRGLPPPNDASILIPLSVTLLYPFEGKLKSWELSNTDLLNGQFTYNNIPQGTHRLQAVFVNITTNDTTSTNVDVTVYPGIGARDLRVRLNLDWSRANLP
jgi:prepilin-type N-terminal cleavage/methylation domain-containing protein